MSKPYRTSPEQIETMPSGIPYIIGNEAAERFSYYGMSSILTIYMTKYLVDASGNLDLMSKTESQTWFHTFVTVAYLCPILGSLLADGLWGKYRTILSLSLFYCVGHFVLALDDTRSGLVLGLGLIALGAGGIKPCVSAHVGDQFGERNKHLLERAFGWFYFSINFGSCIATVLIPAILERKGVFARWISSDTRSAPIAFAIPGVLMLVATIVFWSGRNKFAHIPPGGNEFFRKTFSPEGKRVVGRLALLFFVFVPVFWALYHQSHAAWVNQADAMDRSMNWFGESIEISAGQVQAINPFLIMIYIPLFNLVIYPWLGRFFKLTPMRKLGIGFQLTMLAFATSYLIEVAISADARPHIAWQLVPYVIITAGETMVSITALEYAYTQAPNSMKSFVMSINLMAVALGNAFTAGVNFWIKNFDTHGWLKGPRYYAFFTVLMLVVGIIFAFISRRFREQTYVQGQTEATPA